MTGTPLTRREITEERLLSAVQRALGSQVQTRMPSIPPISQERPHTPFRFSGTYWRPRLAFPTLDALPALPPARSAGFRLLRAENPTLSNPTAPATSTTTATRCTSRPVLPSRFMIACEGGHLDDFPFVTSLCMAQTACKSIVAVSTRVGVSGEPSDIYIKCDTCNTARAPCPTPSQQRRRRERFIPPAADAAPICAISNRRLPTQDAHNAALGLE